MITPPPPTDDLDDLRQMARRPQHYSNGSLAAALHIALNHLKDANDALAAATARAQTAEADLEDFKRMFAEGIMEGRIVVLPSSAAAAIE